MRRLLTFALVFVLAGVPAAAVVCDLMVCVTPTKATLCHEHVLPGAGERMVSTGDGCDHLAVTAPYSTPTPLRQAFEDLAAFAAVSGTLNVAIVSQFTARAPAAYRPPGTQSAVSLPLRI